MANVTPRPPFSPIIQRTFAFSKALSLTVACFLVSNCTVVQPTKIEPKPARSRPLATSPSKVTVTDPEAAAIAPSPTDTAKSAHDDIEIIWALPSEPVEGFVIRYGTEEGKLDKETRILFSEVEQVPDPQHGMVLRYVLRALPRNMPIFISIAAFSMNEESAPSAILSVPPAI
ncbi:MAG: hypothetical protein QY326_04370 [Bdellovibrionota bacterium]|nr:MAG: hypothetical protein QY326_04370 [Bdellovibrionota bacterium]